MGFFLVGPPRGGHSRGLPRGNPSWRRQLGFLLWWSKWSTVALAKQWGGGMESPSAARARGYAEMPGGSSIFLDRKTRPLETGPGKLLVKIK